VVSDGWIVEGEVRWVRVEVAAELYSLHERFVRELLDAGLIDVARESGGALWLAEAMLDRLARIQWMHRHLGIDLEVAAVLAGSRRALDAWAYAGPPR
jgi:hypothetical protein